MELPPHVPAAVDPLPTLIGDPLLDPADTDIGAQRGPRFGLRHSAMFPLPAIARSIELRKDYETAEELQAEPALVHPRRPAGCRQNSAALQARCLPCGGGVSSARSAAGPTRLGVEVLEPPGASRPGGFYFSRRVAQRAANNGSGLEARMLERITLPSPPNTAAPE